MNLDYIIAAETAFFSDDKRVNIIKVFEKIKLTKKGEPKEDLPVPPFSFSIVGKVSGDYGDGVSVLILDKDGEVVLKETKIEAAEHEKDFFNFIIQVNGLLLKNDGNYVVTVKDFDGKNTISEKHKLFSVTKD